MGKRGRKRERDAKMRPTVAIKVIHADGDLHSLGELLKPAVLYGDSVTVYSPIAYLIGATADLSRLERPLERFDTVLRLADEMPTVFPQLDLAPEVLAQMRSLLAFHDRGARGAGRTSRARPGGSDVRSLVEGIDHVWSTELPRVVEELVESRRAHELRLAIDRGAVTVAPLAAGTNPIAECIRKAAKLEPQSSVDPILMDFLDRVAELVVDDRSFALIDPDARPLVRPLVGPDSRLRRSTEVSATAGLVGFLPHFPQLPMDEVLDLRADAQRPLDSFRSSMASMAATFETRPIDDGFDTELEDRWRSTVAPALDEINDAFKARRLLRSAATISMRDVPRLATEAVAVFALGASDRVSLSALLAAGVAASAPTADLACKAVAAALDERDAARSSGFYFLDLIDRAARRKVA